VGAVVAIAAVSFVEYLPFLSDVTVVSKAGLLLLDEYIGERKPMDNE
jgi:hypothetical protein